jgi:hypothetical protein
MKYYDCTKRFNQNVLFVSRDFFIRGNLDNCFIINRLCMYIKRYVKNNSETNIQIARSLSLVKDEASKQLHFRVVSDTKLLS